MENPRPEKVAVVDEVRERFTSSSAALLTEYRGLDVSALGECGGVLAAGEVRARVGDAVQLGGAGVVIGLERGVE